MLDCTPVVFRKIGTTEEAECMVVVTEREESWIFFWGVGVVCFVLGGRMKKK